MLFRSSEISVEDVASDLFLPPAIDFTRSGEDGGQYYIRTGRINPSTGEEDNLIMPMSGTSLYLQGIGKLNIFEVVVFDVALAIDASFGEGIKIFLDGEASVGIGDDFRISADAMGLLAIEDGIALTATLSADLNLGEIVKIGRAHV